MEPQKFCTPHCLAHHSVCIGICSLPANLLPIFINKISPGHSHTYLCEYFLWLLVHNSIWIVGTETIKPIFTLWSFGKTFWPLRLFYQYYRWLDFSSQCLPRIIWFSVQALFQEGWKDEWMKGREWHLSKCLDLTVSNISKANHSISQLSKSMPQPEMLKNLKLNSFMKTYKTF